MKRTFGFKITIVILITLIIVIISSFFAQPQNQKRDLNSSLTKEQQDKRFNFTNPQEIPIGTQYKDPEDIPDCEYLVGGYQGISQGSGRGTLLGYMICNGSKSYHYEFILNDTITRDTYWIKREGTTL